LRFSRRWLWRMSSSGIKNPVRTSQETHYISVTESSQLMLCKIWCFHGGDCEEWRLLRYKNLVRTSQETHYVSATKPNWLMSCKIWDFDSGILFLRSLIGFLVSTNVPSSLILVTMMIVAIRSSETSVLAIATWRNTIEDNVLQDAIYPVRWHTTRGLRQYNRRPTQMLRKWFVTVLNNNNNNNKASISL
jgi:hypothetical protein